MIRSELSRYFRYWLAARLGPEVAYGSRAARAVRLAIEEEARSERRGD